MLWTKVASALEGLLIVSCMMCVFQGVFVLWRKEASALEGLLTVSCMLCVVFSGRVVAG